MLIKLKGDTESQLAQIAMMAYGSGSCEKKGGGRGNIGIINGHVVKFNTHFKWSGDSSKNDPEARNACKAMRTKLFALAREAFSSSEGGVTQAHHQALDKIRRALGIVDNDGHVVNDQLLDRKIVARVITTISTQSDINVWRSLCEKDVKASYSSNGINTSFSSMLTLARANEGTTDINDIFRQIKTQSTENTCLSDVETFHALVEREFDQFKLTKSDSEVLESCLARAIRAEYAVNQNMTVDDIIGPDSMILSLRELCNRLGSNRDGSSDQLVYFLRKIVSLSDLSIKPYIRACNMLLTRCAYKNCVDFKLFAAANRLACMMHQKPESFTPYHVFKEVFAHCSWPDNIQTNKRCLSEGEKESVNCAVALTDSYGHERLETEDENNLALTTNVIYNLGLDLDAMYKFIEDPQCLATRLKGMDAGLFGGLTAGRSEVKDFMSQVKSDFCRNVCDLTILNDDGTEWHLPPAMVATTNSLQSVAHELTMKKIIDFCGTGATDLMKKNLLSALVQCGGFATILSSLSSVTSSTNARQSADFLSYKTHLSKHNDGSVLLKVSTREWLNFDASMAIRYYPNGAQIVETPLKVSVKEQEKRLNEHELKGRFHQARLESIAKANSDLMARSETDKEAMAEAIVDGLWSKFERAMPKDITGGKNIRVELIEYFKANDMRPFLKNDETLATIIAETLATITGEIK